MARSVQLLHQHPSKLYFPEDRFGMVWVKFIVDTAFGILTPGGVLGTVRKFGAIDGIFLTAVRSADGN
jgi:hypothetical protein